MLLRRDVGALRPLRRWAGSRISVVPGAGARMGGSARRRRSRSHRRAGPWKRRVTSSCLTVVSSTVDLEEGWEQARKQTARLEGWDVHAMRGLVAPSQGGGGQVGVDASPLPAGPVQELLCGAQCERVSWAHLSNLLPESHQVWSPASTSRWRMYSRGLLELQPSLQGNH